MLALKLTVIQCILLMYSLVFLYKHHISVININNWSVPFVHFYSGIYYPYLFIMWDELSEIVADVISIIIGGLYVVFVYHSFIIYYIFRRTQLGGSGLSLQSTTTDPSYCRMGYVRNDGSDRMELLEERLWRF